MPNDFGLGYRLSHFLTGRYESLPLSPQGKRVVTEDGTEAINDMYHENNMLQSENAHLRTRVKAIQETITALTARNTQLLAEKAAGEWIAAGSGRKICGGIRIMGGSGSGGDL